MFIIKYMRTLGFDVTNDIFAENAWYFRNSLVRANYTDIKNGVYETTEYLEIFLRNLLLHEQNPLYNRKLHIKGIFNDIEKADIDTQKADIEIEKTDIDTLKSGIEDMFTPKTYSNICKLQKELSSKIAFGRSDVQKVLGLKATRSSELLREMVEKGIIQPVLGYGKGKYQFIGKML